MSEGEMGRGARSSQPHPASTLALLLNNRVTLTKLIGISLSLGGLAIKSSCSLSLPNFVQDRMRQHLQDAEKTEGAPVTLFVLKAKVG